MDIANHKLPLFVDLDGTLIKSDWMLEAILAMVRDNPFSIFQMLIWLAKGRSSLKRHLAEAVVIDIALLPFNPEFLEFLKKEKHSHRELILISASDQKAVTAASDHYGLFDMAIGSDGIVNLKSEAKLARIKAYVEGGSFSYAGNSADDFKVWQAADEIVVVNAESSIAEKIKSSNPQQRPLLEFDTPPSLLPRLFNAMRPHQWLKNFLIFLPLILSHRLSETDLLVLAALAFISFSLCASSVYFVNDMLDIQSDRQHNSKSKRPFAAGTLPLAYGVFGAPLLFLLSLVFASLVGTEFFAVLIGYWLITCLYSLYLKRLYLIDVVTLSLLYTLRIIAGSAAIAITTTDWLIAFSGFLFLGLALLKRTTELRNLVIDGQVSTQGRDYSTDRLLVVTVLGVMSSAASVLVFMVYINAANITLLYDSPELLWAICPLQIAMLARVWLKAHAGTLDEDPVLFASHDRLSQIMLILSGTIFWLAI
ncbi:MAG: 4-hydroxybenzoate polyprenyltransferase [Pseudohongiellaceae bacterium]|jgi:4-hydroxybenzoate polyprenyltransferase